MHKGTYADDCLVSRVTQHKAFIVATCDKDLKRRIRKVCTYSIFVGLFRNGVSVEIVYENFFVQVPGVPIMFLSNHRYVIERMPDAYGAPKGSQ